MLAGVALLDPRAATAKCSPSTERREYEVVTIEVDDGSTPSLSDTTAWTGARVSIVSREDGIGVTVEADGTPPKTSILEPE